MKQYLLIVLSVLLSAVLCACAPPPSGADTDTGDSTAGTPTRPSDNNGEHNNSAGSAITGRFDSARKESEAALGQVGTADFDGLSFIFTCESASDMFGDYDSSSILSQEKYARIELLAYRFNADIIIAEETADGIVEGLSSGKSSGMVYTHMLSCGAGEVGTLSYRGLVGQINALPFVNISMPYYDAEFCEKMRTPTGLYALFGDACREERNTGVIFYNDTLAQTLGITGLEQSVLEGKWTLDMFNSTLSRAHASLADEDARSLCLVGDEDLVLRNFFVTSDMNSASLNRGELRVNDNRDRGEQLVSSLREMLSYCAVTEGEDDISGFSGGGALFMFSSLGTAERIFNMRDVWGLLPYPVFAEGEEYSTPMSRDTDVIMYADASPDANEIGVMTEALFACSYRILDAVRFDEFLHGYVRNEKTLDMLSVITRRTSSDFCILYADEFGNYGDGTLHLYLSCVRSDRSYAARFENYVYTANRSLDYVK